MKKICLLVGTVALHIIAYAQVSFNDYEYTVPESWSVQKNKDFIMLAQSGNVAAGCVIQILLPTTTSGNLEKDAKDVFNMMYAGWQYRKAGEKQYDLYKGYTQQGLAYCRMEAPMQKQRPDGYYYDYEDGVATVISVNNQVMIIAARHERLIACECKRKYNLWNRFFKSFTIKNVAVPENKTDAAKNIVGVWKTAESMAVSDYVFAANGNYQHGGALGSSSTSRDQHYEYIHIKTYSFAGDGSYTIANNELTLKKRGSKNEEKVPVRFEWVNHGGTGWKERMYMRGKDAAGEFEAGYEKQQATN